MCFENISPVSPTQKILHFALRLKHKDRVFADSKSGDEVEYTGASICEKLGGGER